MTMQEQNYGPASAGVFSDGNLVPTCGVTVSYSSGGSVSHGQSTDVQLARLVRNALEWSPFLEGIDIDVTAANGSVTLAGSCPYKSLGRMAQMITYTIPGVRSVVNEIQIVRDSAR